MATKDIIDAIMNKTATNVTQAFDDELSSKILDKLEFRKKELAKQTRLDEKRRFKDKKKPSKEKVLKTENIPLEKGVVRNTAIAKIDNSSTEFKKLVEKIIKKNKFRSYPDINDTPN